MNKLFLSIFTLATASFAPMQAMMLSAVRQAAMPALTQAQRPLLSVPQRPTMAPAVPTRPLLQPRSFQRPQTLQAHAFSTHSHNNNKNYQNSQYFKPEHQTKKSTSVLLGAAVAAGIGYNLLQEDDEVSNNLKQLQNVPPASLWQLLARGKDLSPREKSQIFMQDCSALAQENHKIPAKGTATVRIATYNVHFWTNPLRQGNFNEILDVIKNIDADILILEEVNLGPTRYNNMQSEEFFQKVQELGYKVDNDNIFCSTSYFNKAACGNLILSRYGYKVATKTRFKNNERSHREKRCVINTKIELPNKKTISVYGTHLDVYDKSGFIRQQQIQELLKMIDDDNSENILIAGDFNEVRPQDYNYTVNAIPLWNILQRENLKRFDPTSTQGLELLEQNNFSDCFSRAQLAGPKFTVWSGTVVDFIMLNQKWNLPIDGCYVHYSAASDHLPVIMDVKI